MKKVFKRITSALLTGVMVFSTFMPFAEASSTGIETINKSSVTDNTYSKLLDTVSESVYANYNGKEKKYIVKLKNPDNADKLIKSNLMKGKLSKKTERAKFIQVNLNDSEKELLSKDQDVEYIEVDSTVNIASVGNVKKDTKTASTETIPWGIHSVGADLIDEKNMQGNNIKTAILDTGISKHEDLKISGGVSFVPNHEQYADDNGHGTHVAGTVAAINNKIGVVGVAPRSHIYAVKVLDQNGGGTYSQVINGIYWAIDNKMDIISMSFGGTEDSRALHEAIQEAERQGILIIAAAGNRGSGQETELYPALYPEVISVGAVTKAHQRASYSSTGTELDLVAPGTGILSTTNDGGYGILSGTSMAAPHVTGAAAVILAKNKKMNAQQVRELLYRTATPLGSTNEYGHGLVNLAKALGITNQPIPPVEQVDPVPNEPDQPSNDFNINKKDAEILKYSKQLLDLKLKAIRANDKSIVKEIDGVYNHLLSYSKTMHQLPVDISKAIKKQPNQQKIAASSYFDTQKDSFLKLESYYKEAISKYASALSVPFSQQSGITVLSTNKIGDGQTVVKGDPATVSLTLDQPHSAIDVYVDQINLTPVLGPVTIHHDSSNNVSYTWQTTTSTVPGDYIITLHYPDVTGYDDQFLIHVVDNSGGNPGTPAKPTGLRVTGQTSNSITISWNSVSGATSYKTQLDGTSQGSTGSTSYTFNGLTANKTYTLGVAAVNSSNISSTFATITATTNPPAIPDIPSGLWASSTHNSITLNWSSVVGASSYKIRFNGQDVGNTSSSSYTFTGLMPLTEYTLGVAAVNASGSYIDFAYLTTKTKAYPLYLDSPIDVDLPENSTQVFSFTPSTSGTYKITTSPYGGFGAESDTLLDLYSDSSLTDLIETNDDTNGTFAELQPTLQAGGTYYIKLYGFDSSELHTRIIATALNLSIPTINLDIPANVDRPAGQNAIFAFTPTTDGLYKINTGFYADSPSSGINDTILDIYRDITLNDLVLDGHNDDASDGTNFSEVNVSLQHGVTYFIKMSTYGAAAIHASLKVSLSTQINFITLTNKVAVNVSKRAEEKEYFRFTAPETGLYRFFTSAIQGSGSTSDTEITLYSDAGLNNQIAINDDVVGEHPYGALFSKIEYTLSAGTTYYLKLRNVNYGNPLTARLMVEDSFQSAKTTAKGITWDTEYTNDISSRYDVDYYKITVTEPKYIKLNIDSSKIILEDSLGNVLSTTTSSSSVYLKDQGVYYIRVADSGYSSGSSMPVQYSFKVEGQLKPDWYKFTMDDGHGGNVEVYLSDIGGRAGEGSTPITAITKRNNQSVYKQYSVNSNGNWYDTGNIYAGAPGQPGGIGMASVEVLGLPSIEDIQQQIENKSNELINKFYDYVGIDPADLTDEDKRMLATGVIYGIDDNVHFGVAQWALNVYIPEDNYYYMRAKAFTDTVFTAAYTVAAAGSAAGAVQALINSGTMGSMALAASPTGYGGAALGAVALEELARSAAFAGVSYLSGKMATRSQNIVKTSAAKLKETLGYKIRNVADDILDRFEGYPNSNGGHTLSKHVSMTNEELSRRAIQDELDATSFTNKSTAIKAVQQNLRKNASQIEDWLKNSNEGRKSFVVEHEYSIGYGAEGITGKMIFDLKKSRMVLVRDSNVDIGFYILTSFPTL
ncbi:S8 family serine peptidase [Paenibacillus sp. 32352]|uniref:S8 family serine peptidase n=1 Tax=Paenibacillus sp. 32352 TaxID=1969111 RepID=UPI0015C498B0|nr:S8 family serine peptidase [Paenibacillus sp. 32352]